MAHQKIVTLLSLWLPPIIWAGMIFWLSSYNTLPGPEIIWWDFLFKKCAHMFVYGGLFFLVQRAYNHEKTPPSYILPMVLTIAYAFTDEIHQSYVMGRTALLSDIGYDTIGASLVMLKLKQLI